MPTPTSSAVRRFDPTRVQLQQSQNPSSWLFAEYEPGKRITADMVSFDLDRADVHVNNHGVVLFYDAMTARTLLRMPA